MKSFRLTPCAAAVAVALLQMSAPAQALNCTLTTNGPWQTTTDWSCGVRPGSGDAATINIGGLVTINQAEQITTLSNAGTINIDAFTLSLLGGGSTTNAGTINVGTASVTGALQVFNNINNAGGTINVRNGSVINQFGAAITGGTISTTGTGALVAANSSNNFLNSATLNGQLDMATNAGFERIGGTGLTLNGAININQNSVLTFEGGAQSLAGSGTITFGNTGSSNRLTLEAGGTLTTGVNTTIHGQSGTIGGAVITGGSATLNNGGVVSADVAGGQIFLIPATTNNSNTLSAKNGAQLVLGGTVNNVGSGHIDAIGTGSNVYQNAVTVTGGTINTSGGGTFIAANSSANALSGVTLNGTLDMATNAGFERIVNGLTLASGSNVAINANSVFTFDGGSQTLGGNGTVTFGATGSSNRIGIENGGTLTIASGVLIHGENGTIGGQVLTGGPATIINNGTISADVSGGTISILTNNGATNAVQNNGILSAVNGGTMVLNSNVTGNAGSAINVGAGSTIVQNGVVVSGVVNTTGNGNFVASNSGANVLNNVTFTGALNLASNTGSETVRGNLALNGAVNINANSTFIFEGGTQNLTGNGTITFGSTGSSNRLAVDNTGTLIIGAGILIHGENGTIGNQVQVGGPATIVNNGTISADVAGGTITLLTNNGATGAVQNNGLLSAQNGGTLLLSSNVQGNAGSSIVAGAGSSVIQNGVTLSGTINTSGSGSFIATNSGANLLNGVTLNGNLDLATHTGFEQVTNGLTLNGGININQNSVLVFAGGTQALNGNGVITFGSTGGSNRLAIDNGGTLDVGSGITIHGQNGTIGNQVVVGGTSTLNNNGNITADVAGGSISVLAATTNNSNIISATNGGQIVLNGGFNNLGSGRLDAVGAGSNVYQNGVTVSGGAINSSNGGVFIASNSGGNVLSGVTLNGTLDMATSTGIEQVSNGLTVNGAVNINANSALVFAGGTQTLGGTGTITLGSYGGSNRIAIDNSGIVNVASGVTIHGENGTIGSQLFAGGSNTLNNNGTIRADVSGGLITVATNTLTNGGMLAATAGTLTIQPAFTGTGTVMTAGTGRINIGGSSSTGNLINNGTGAAALNLAANNITVSSDYDNASFGTGNGFNKRANVSGTGQILAAGNTAQALSGSNIANGGTSTSTLTIGNVHVGATTTNYQIANSGTNGASLRGAIETSVNGGNITDSRLSGTGVSAGNYGPIGIGSNSGNLGVTFTASTAGALAPLSGQAVHIANNFDNVAEQTLNIVLASGAAAYNYAAGSATPTPIVFANAHVGDSRTQAITVTNAGPSGAFTEKLDASFGTNTGNALNNNGSVGLLAASASNNSALVASLNTTAAGARSGTVTVNYQSDGTGTSGLGTSGVGSQTISVSGNVYNLASSSTIGAINFGLHHVGDGVVTQNVSVSNTAAAGLFSEGLDTTFGAFTGAGGSRITTTGSVTNLAAGSTNSGSLQVQLDTSTVGTVNGSLHFNQASNGTISGLGNTTLAGQDAAVTADIQGTGTVVRFAAPQINTAAPVNFGAVRQGTTQSTALSITNNVPNDGFSESLVAGIAGTNGAATGSGGFGPPTATASLVAGATDTTHVLVGLNTTNAGHQTGNVNVNFKSDGTMFDGGMITDLGNTAVGVQADVYRLANASLTTNVVTVAARVGDAAPTRTISITNASPDIYTEGLTVTRGATSAGFTGSGSITNLAAAGTSTAIGVSLNTATAGTFTGTQALNYVSTGTGTTGAADVGVGSGSVTLNGTVYTPAVAQLNTSVVNFGIVHVGDNVAQRNVSVTNAALVTGTNDVLQSSFSSATGPFTGSGSLGAGLGAQQMNATGLAVGLNTATAGVYSGSATFGAASHDGELSDAALANLAVGLMGQVNNYASDTFTFGSGAGTLTRSGSTFTLDYGTVAQNSGTRSTTLFAMNDATGPADALDGSYVFNDAIEFGEAGFTDFFGLAAGQSTSGLSLSFDSLVLGTFSDSITLRGIGRNASDYSGAIGDITLVIRGMVAQDGPPSTDVPEPDSLLLLVLGVPLLLVRRARTARKQVTH